MLEIMAQTRWLSALALLVSSTGPARADHWFSAELPAAAAFSGPQEQLFSAGAMPAAGAYIGTERFSLGMRVRAGVLRNGSAPAGHFFDPGTGSLVTGGLAARLGISGGWLELVAGGGMTGRDAVPAVEAGVGWSFDAGSVDIGPSVRVLRVVSGSDMPGSADLVLVGVDVQLGRHHAAALPHVAPAPPIVEPPPAPPPPVDSDKDAIEDSDSSCSDLLTSADPSSGCPAVDAITVIDDRIILDDRVLFDTDRAHVKSRGREIIGQIADAWHAHPDWKALTVEGHADIRGTDDYNLSLSQLRADRVRALLVSHGFAADSVKAIGYGRTRPRDLGTSEAAHEHNRRVEFVIDRSAP